MEIKAEEISQIIKKQIKEYGAEVAVAETGTIISIGDGIARIHGLDKAMAGELLEFPGGISGMVLNLEEDNVGAAILGDFSEIKEGDTVKLTGRIVEVPVGEALSALRAYAFAHCQSVASVAADIVARRLRLTNDTDDKTQERD